MKFKCESCQKRYNISDDRIKGRLLKIRCKNCNNLMEVSWSKQKINEDKKVNANLHDKTETKTNKNDANYSSTYATLELTPILLNSLSTSQSKTLSKPAEIKVKHQDDPVSQFQQVNSPESHSPPLNLQPLAEQLTEIPQLSFQSKWNKLIPYAFIIGILGVLAYLILPSLNRSLNTPKTIKASLQQIKEKKQEKKQVVRLTKKSLIDQSSSKMESTTSTKDKTKSQETSSKETSSKETSSKETSSKETSSKETSKKAKKAKKHRKSTRKRSKNKKIKSKTHKVNKGQGLEPSTIQMIVQQNVGSLTFCYNRLKKKDPDLAGIKTRLSFTVETDGKIKRSRLSGVYKKTKLEKCIQRAVQRWYFPKAEASTRATYPLSFQ
jgi:predicted Zn finger-like uncharacterized protein